VWGVVNMHNPAANSIEIVFVDEATNQAVDWDVAWRHFLPKTPFGLAARDQLRPFLPGQEADFCAALDQLRADCAQAQAWSRSGLTEILEQTPDIRSALALLENGEQSLDMLDCLTLKHFVWRMWPALTDTLPPWTEVQHWRTLRQLFGADTEASFRAEQVGGDDIERANEVYRQAVQKHAEAARALSDSWLERIGMRPNRDGLLVFRTPLQQAVAEQWKLDLGLRWLRDTPFESVFEVLPTPALAAASGDLEVARQRLDAAHDAALRNFTATLRRHLPSWQQVLGDVTALDLRLAKVRANLALNGCIPDYDASELVVDGAVDVVASTHLAAAGQVFQPVDLAIHSGLNVITGPNMGGKTLAMRSWCVCQLLAQYGLPVPAQAMKTRLFDAVRFLADAATDVARGLSSFGQEVVGLAAVLCELERTQAVLVCLDEPFRTTNPLEGEALTVAVGRHLQQRLQGQGAAMVATHFTAPLRMPAAHVHQVGWRADGGQTAIEVAATLGLPQTILQAAAAIAIAAGRHGDANL